MTNPVTNPAPTPTPVRVRELADELGDMRARFDAAISALALDQRDLRDRDRAMIERLDRIEQVLKDIRQALG